MTLTEKVINAVNAVNSYIYYFILLYKSQWYSEW